VRSCQKLPLCPIEPMPASSEMGSPLAKAEPIRDGSSTSAIQEGENAAAKQQWQPEKGVG